MNRIALLALVGMAAAGCGKHEAAETVAENPRLEDSTLVLPASVHDAGSVGSVVVAPPDRSDSVVFGGRLVWDEDVTVRIFSPFAGRVTRVATDIGQSVRAGQTLALIEAPDFGQALADARKASADLTLAIRSLARQRDLLTHGVAARKDVEAAEADSVRAATDRQRAEARVVAYGADSTASAQGFPLRSPLAGLVVERNLNPGQEVRPDQMLASAPQLMSPLFLVTNPARLWVQLDIPEQDVGRVTTGQEIRLHVLAQPGKVFKGRLTLILSEIDPTTRTVKARGVVDNADRSLKAEMLVAGQVSVAGPAGITVPAQAVFLEGTNRYVFVQDGAGRFRHRSVTTGPARNGAIPVLNGLKPGERVVVDGMLLLNQLYHSLVPTAPRST